MFAGSANSHETPASVTSATPHMDAQWLVSTTTKGRFCGSAMLLPPVPGRILSVKISHQICHLRTVEAWPGDAFGFHLIEHARTVMPERCDHGGGGKRTARAADFRRSARRVFMTGRAALGRKHAASGSGIARVLKELIGPKIVQEVAHFTRVESHEFGAGRGRPISGKHPGRVIPHLRRDLGQRLAPDAASQSRARPMAPGTTIRGEHDLAVIRGSDAE